MVRVLAEVNFSCSLSSIAGGRWNIVFYSIPQRYLTLPLKELSAASIQPDFVLAQGGGEIITTDYLNIHAGDHGTLDR